MYNRWVKATVRCVYVEVPNLEVFDSIAPVVGRGVFIINSKSVRLVARGYLVIFPYDRMDFVFAKVLRTISPLRNRVTVRPVFSFFVFGRSGAAVRAVCYPGS